MTLLCGQYICAEARASDFMRGIAIGGGVVGCGEGGSGAWSSEVRGGIGGGRGKEKAMVVAEGSVGITRKTSESGMAGASRGGVGRELNCGFVVREGSAMVHVVVDYLAGTRVVLWEHVWCWRLKSDREQGEGEGNV